MGHFGWQGKVGNSRLASGEEPRIGTAGANLQFDFFRTTRTIADIGGTAGVAIDTGINAAALELDADKRASGFIALSVIATGVSRSAFVGGQTWRGRSGVTDQVKFAMSSGLLAVDIRLFGWIRHRTVPLSALRLAWWASLAGHRQVGLIF